MVRSAAFQEFDADSIRAATTISGKQAETPLLEKSRYAEKEAVSSSTYHKEVRTGETARSGATAKRRGFIVRPGRAAQQEIRSLWLRQSGAEHQQRAKCHGDGNCNQLEGMAI